MTRSFIVPSPSASAKSSAIPSPRFQMFLIREGILDEKGIDELEKQVEDEMQEAADRALAAAPAQPGLHHAVCLFARSRSHVVSVSRPQPCIPTADDGKSRAAQDHGRPDQRHACKTRCGAMSAS